MMEVQHHTKPYPVHDGGPQHHTKPYLVHDGGPQHHTKPYPVHDGGPSLHGDALEDSEHGKGNVVKGGDSIVGALHCGCTIPPLSLK